MVSIPRLISRALDQDTNVTETHDQVESLKIEHCVSLHVNLDLKKIIQPFYQLRLENIDNVSIRDIKLNHDGDLDLVIRNVRTQVTLSGRVTCEDCDYVTERDGLLAGGDTEDVRDMAQPTLVLQLKNVTRTQMIYLDVAGVNTRLSARTVDRLAIDNTVIDKLARNSVEVWYADTFSIENTAVNQVN